MGFKDVSLNMFASVSAEDCKTGSNPNAQQ